MDSKRTCDGRGHGEWQRAWWVAGKYGNGGKRAGHTRLLYMGPYVVSVMGMLQTGVREPSNCIKPTFLGKEKQDGF